MLSSRDLPSLRVHPRVVPSHGDRGLGGGGGLSRESAQPGLSTTSIMRSSAERASRVS